MLLPIVSHTTSQESPTHEANNIDNSAGTPDGKKLNR